MTHVPAGYYGYTQSMLLLITTTVTFGFLFNWTIFPDFPKNISYWWCRILHARCLSCHPSKSTKALNTKKIMAVNYY